MQHAIKVFVYGFALITFFSCEQKQTVTDRPVTDVPPLFKRVPADSSGINFANRVDENINNYFDYFAYVYNGGGVGMGDINNDGLVDIFFTGNEVPNKLYLNEGNFRFKDISQSAGVEGNGRWNNGVTLVDINSDGWLDIYVCKGGWHDTQEQRTNLLYVNQGDLTFKEQAKDYGLAESGYSIHASFFDLDNDNDLDAYITNRPDSFDLPLTEMIRQKKLSPASSRDKLFLNDKGKFTEISARAGITNNFGYALSIVTADVNNDGYTDIFVANDFAEGDYLYINQKNGTFKEQIKKATNHISMYSMGTDIADINNDGLEDIMVSEMLPEDYQRSKVSMPSMDVPGFYAIVNGGMHKQYMHNALHLNQGNLFFSDIAQMAGVAKTEWSWACLLSDFDNDGFRDLFVANGYRRDVFDGDVGQRLSDFVAANRNKYSSPTEMLQKGFKDFINLYDPIKVKNYVFRNKGDLTFDNVGSKWGITEATFSNGAAVGDLDNDGDLDLVINNLDEEAFVYRNTTKNNYLKINLEGPPSNRHGIGAKVTLYQGGELQYFENKTVRGYLSSNDPMVHFGLGAIASVDSVTVVWSDGRENRLGETQGNQLVTIKYADAKPAGRKDVRESLFTESVSELTSPYVHKENEFNEYAEQILLPHMFSKNGPFISTADVNKDGEEDFFVGGASGQAGTLFVQKNGKLAKRTMVSFDADRAFEDMGSVFFDADQDGDADLYVVSGGSEFADGSDNYNDRLYVNDGKGNFGKSTRVKTQSSGSCVVPFDADADGDLDLFRGGQVMANAYPKSPRSYVLINDMGTFSDQTQALAPALLNVGMVAAAAVTDLNGDSKAELVVVGEWMPVTIFALRDGKLADVSEEYGTAYTEGWWNTVTASDMDGDGDQDLLLGNLGENYKFKASKEKPFQVYAKDFDGNGTNDVFLARYLQDSLLVPIRGKECTSQQMPVISEKFPTYQAFAQSDLPGILGSDIKSALHKKAHLFSSVMLLNEQGKFKQVSMPVDAQLSTVNAIVVDDFDADGIKDILMAGNKFDTEVETTPADGSPGVFLKGLGGMKFKSLKSVESGFFVPYNVKDVKLLKSGNTWRVLVSSNSDKLRVFTVRKSLNKQAVALK